MNGLHWPANYDPESSMQNAMMKAEQHMEYCNGTMTTDMLAVRIANVDMWVRIAQVHATNMQTQALRSTAAKPMWRDVMPEQAWTTP